MADDKRVIELPQILIIGGQMFLPIFDVGTDLLYKIDVQDLLGSGTSSNYTWDPLVNYLEDRIVSYSQNPGDPPELWISLNDINTGNPPGPGSLFWTPGNRSRGSLSPYTAGIFLDDYPIVTKKNSIYLLTNLSRPYNSTDFDAELNAGDWVNLSGRDLFQVDVSGAITLDAREAREVDLIGDADITAPKNWIFARVTNFKEGSFKFIVSGGLHTQTFPAEVVVANAYNAEYDSGAKTWTPLEEGKYEAYITYDGAEFKFVISGPFN